VAADAKLVVVGEAPGRNEVSLGAPFVGKSGTTLRSALTGAGLDPDHDVTYVNTVNCRPPDNSDPPLKAKICCSPLLEGVLEQSKAPAVLAVGRHATDRLVGRDFTELLLKSRSSWDGYCYRPDREFNTAGVFVGRATQPSTDPEDVYKSGKRKGQRREHRVDIKLPVPTDARAVVGALHPSAIQRKGFKEVQRLRQACRVAKQVIDGLPIFDGPSFSRAVEFPHEWKVPEQPVDTALIVDIENNELSITQVGLCEVDILDGTIRQMGSWDWSPALKALLQRVLSDDTPYSSIVAHNATHDWLYLIEEGVEFSEAKTMDTMFMAQLEAPDLPKGLGNMWRYLPPRVPWKHLGHITGYGAQYNLDDVHTEARLFFTLHRILERKGQLRLAQRVTQAMFSIRRMSIAGLGIDVPRLQAWSEEKAKELETLSERLSALKPDVSPSSPTQVGHWLFEELGLPILKTTDTGKPSTEEKVLQRLLPLCEPEVREWLELKLERGHITKALSTWGQGFVDKLDIDGVLRPSYVPSSKDGGELGSAAGRLSSSPNVQNIPAKVRFAIVPATAGWVMLYVDYSAIENRVMFQLAGDTDMLAKLNTPGYDPHMENLAMAHGVLTDLWLSDPKKWGHRLRDGVPIDPGLIVDRPNIKTFIYGYTYNAGDDKIAKSLGIKRVEARTIREGYETLHPLVAQWKREVLREARGKKYLQNVFGRIRYFWAVIPDVHCRNSAVNFPPQSTVADMFYTLFPDVEAGLREKAGGARILTQVHDAFLVEAAPEYVRAAAGVLKEEMEREWPQVAPGFKVPVDVEVGWNWGEMTSLEEWEKTHG